ncbi:unnamed protein product, partial [Amoebophrya sp. A25]
LPVTRHKREILAAYARSDVVVLQSATGSGKTTQVPQFLAKFVHRKVLCTQPRRVAATSVAARVASEMGSPLGAGGDVGYRVRFQECCSALNKILFLTDGMAVREAVQDPLFSQYSCILLDEAHERSVQTDILMGLVKQALVQRRRMHREWTRSGGKNSVTNEGASADECTQEEPVATPPPQPLKVIVMSATLEVRTFVNFFSNASTPDDNRTADGSSPNVKDDDPFQVEVVEVPGRQHPVKVYYTPTPTDDYLLACATACLQLHRNKPSGGDILCFLPGQEAIESLHHLLEERRRNEGDFGSGRVDTELKRLSDKEEVPLHSEGPAEDNPNLASAAAHQTSPGAAPPLILEDDLLICPLYAALPFDQQMSVFTPAASGTRKVVLATNIAETSITIPGIRYVVDAGYVKLKIAHPTTGVECLKIVETSRAQAEQRAGRAGREAPGECYRIYPESFFRNKFLAQTPPEILRTEFSQLFLLLKSLRVQKVDKFPFLDVPPKQNMIKACFFLKRVQALDRKLELTTLGQQLARLPLHPLFGLALIRSVEFECVAEVLSIVAMLSLDAVFFLNVENDRAKKETRDSLRHPLGDQLTLLQVYRKWKRHPAKLQRHFCHVHGLNHFALQRAEKVRTQLKELLIHALGVQHITSCGG